MGEALEAEAHPVDTAVHVLAPVRAAPVLVQVEGGRNRLWLPCHDG